MVYAVIAWVTVAWILIRGYKMSGVGSVSYLDRRPLHAGGTLLRFPRANGDPDSAVLLNCQRIRVDQVCSPNTPTRVGRLTGWTAEHLVWIVVDSGQENR